MKEAILDALRLSRNVHAGEKGSISGTGALLRRVNKELSTLETVLNSNEQIGRSDSKAIQCTTAYYLQVGFYSLAKLKSDCVFRRLSHGQPHKHAVSSRYCREFVLATRTVRTSLWKRSVFLHLRFPVWVDVVCEEGRRLINCWAVHPNSLHLSWTGQSFGKQGIWVRNYDGPQGKLPCLSCR